MKYGTHHLCTACYSALEPGRTPVQLKDAETLPCCRCGKAAADGIYYRAPLAQFIHCSTLVHVEDS